MGFEFHKTGRYKENTYWVCARRPECMARATTKGLPPEAPTILKCGTHSGHAPDREKTSVHKVVNTMKQLAAQHPEMEPANIIRDNMANLGEEVISQLPQRPALRRPIQRKRQADLPKNPLSLNEIRELPEEYQTTSAGESRRT